MAEYIEREAAMDIFGDVPMWVGYYEPYPFEVHRAIVGVVKLIKEELGKVPAADVAPVVHGLWIPIRESEMTGWDPAVAGRDPIGGYICSACKEEAVYHEGGKRPANERPFRMAEKRARIA